MSTGFDELDSQATQIDTATSAPTGEDVYAGREYFDTSTGRRYLYNGTAWHYIQYTSTSTSTTSTSTTSTSTTSTSTTSTSTTSTSSSSSTSLTTTSTTLY